MPVNRFESISDIIISGVFLMALIVVGFYAITQINETVSRQQAIKAAKCHPYSVLSSYELDGKQYVVCGNQESKLLEVKDQ